MGIKTEIEWCDSTVNPTENCDGCELWNSKLEIRKCYAGKMVERWKGLGAFDKPIVLKPGRMAETLKWKDLTDSDRPSKPWLNGMPRVIFVGDMADIFSKDVPFEFLKEEVVDMAVSAPHLYLLLTKQANRMAEFTDWLTSAGTGWPHNLWVGVSVTSQSTLTRAHKLRFIPARHTFVSYEPALEEINFKGYTDCFDFMIIGGESGVGASMLDVGTIRRTLAWCRLHHVKTFVKQMGTAWARAHGAASFKGGDMSEWPEGIRVREMPALLLKVTP